MPLYALPFECGVIVGVGNQLVGLVSGLLSVLVAFQVHAVEHITKGLFRCGAFVGVFLHHGLDFAGCSGVNMDGGDGSRGSGAGCIGQAFCRCRRRHGGRRGSNSPRLLHGKGVIKLASDLLWGGDASQGFFAVRSCSFCNRLDFRVIRRMYGLTFRRRLCGAHTFDGLDARKEHVENAPNHKALSHIFNAAQQFAVVLFSSEIGRDGLEKVGVIA